MWSRVPVTRTNKYLQPQFHCNSGELELLPFVLPITIQLNLADGHLLYQSFDGFGI